MCPLEKVIPWSEQAAWHSPPLKGRGVAARYALVDKSAVVTISSGLIHESDSFKS